MAYLGIGALRIMGEIMGVDRAFVIEELPDTPEAFRYRYTWERQGIEISLTTFDFASHPLDPAVLADWKAQLRLGIAVEVQRSDQGAGVAALLERVGNKSMLIVPIIIDGLLWGALIVDACQEDRIWNAGEIDTLRIFADLAGAIIRRSEIQSSLSRSETRFQVLSATAQDAIIAIDGQGAIEHWNASAERILGYRADEVIGRPINGMLIPLPFRAEAEKALAAFLSTGQGSLLGKTLELAALRKDGEEIAIEVSLAGALIDGNWQAVGILRDITARKRAEALALRMARHDALTGLANRAVFIEALNRAIGWASGDGPGFAVLCVDLDYFKDVNDTLGHPVGDQLLKAVADRLLAATRSGDTVARFGGDEFAVILSGVTSPAGLTAVAEKLIEALGRPFRLADNEIYSGASIGVAVNGPDADDPESLLANADVALYRAKLQGRNTFRFFTPAMDAETQTRVKLGTELRAAIDQDQLFLMYQPQVELDTGRIIGVEALLRWRHPVRGILAPDLFIPIAEQIGCIGRIGHWVLRSVCTQGKAWMDAGIVPVRLAVNVSALQFRTALAFEQDVLAALDDSGLPADKLELELTETVLMDAARDHGASLLRLRALGVTVAIDDFGTGYSSLDYLSRFPSNRIKIAQTFVAGIGVANADAAIIRATIGLATELGIAVIAEGVETIQQAELLRTWGCQEAQGYLFSRPLLAPDTEILLREGLITPALLPVF